MAWIAALIIGVLNAAVLYIFEFVGIEGTVWLWDDVLGTDTERWRVIPVAIVLGLILTATYKLLKTPRIHYEETGDLIEELAKPPSTLKAIGGVLLIGAVSLLAGASLGPEAALMAYSAGIGAYLSGKLKVGSRKQVLVLASVGALLVAFVNSLFLVAAPLLMLFRQSRKAKTRISLQAIGMIVLAGLGSYGALWGIHLLVGTEPRQLIPPLPELQPQDYWVALGLGFVSAFLAMTLNYMVRLFSRVAVSYSELTFPGKDWILGAGAGLGLGFLYYSGGPLVQFSGKVGTELLAETGAQLSIAVLLSMVVIKLLATAWSSAMGYKGGLVFPAVFMGLALGLIVAKLAPDLGVTGATVGALAGILTAAIGAPLIAAIFLVAALPFGVWPVAACAVVGVLGYELILRFVTKKKPA